MMFSLGGENSVADAAAHDREFKFIQRLKGGGRGVVGGFDSGLRLVDALFHDVSLFFWMY